MKIIKKGPLTILTLLAVLQLNILTAYGQFDKKKYRDSILGREIKIGQKVPDLIFYNVINSKTNILKQSDFENKAIIIDFWATWCGPCVEGIPKLIDFKKQFKDDLEIIGVSAEPENKVSVFIENLKKKFSVNYPICSEKNNSKNIYNLPVYRYFPHTSIPHYVLIDKNRILRGVMEKDFVTVENIRNLIAGKELQFEFKDDYSYLRVDYDANLTLQMEKAKSILFAYDSTSLSKFRYSSILTNEIPGVGPTRAGTIFPSSIFYNRRFQAINNTLSTLFAIAYGDDKIDSSMMFPRNRTEYDIENIALLTEFNDLKSNSRYCYDLILPRANRDKLFELARQDLDRYFGVKSKMVPKNKKVYKLVIIDKNIIPVTKGGKSSLKFSPLGLSLHNQPISIIANYIGNVNHGPDHPIIVDETKEKISIDLEINASLKNLTDIKEELHKYGLDLVPSTKMLDVLVITDCVHD